MAACSIGLTSRAMAERIVIRQFALGDFEPDLEAIVAAAREAGPDFEIVVERATPTDPRKRAVIGQSILEVVEPAAAGYAFSKVMDAIIATAKASVKARRKPKTWPRTHIVKILGPDGSKVLSEVKVSDDPPA
jgi:hypothetical protein